MSDGVQGGYLVAAVLPACLVAVLAYIVFSEVVEGFACIIGGFCLAMWFLCLAPGGLIQSTGGRAGFIAALCVAAYALWFSRYTRVYGTIVSISFAGATSIVLGIDCFSQAGLKEFWVYIWNLNSRLFPLDTNTYPVTRGIKVEIAVIIILTVFGIISQLKLWNTIKQRREEKQRARLQDEEDREHLEADLGRNVEEQNRQEKPMWEAIYGNAAGSSSASIFHSATDSNYDISGRSKPGTLHGSVVELTDLQSGSDRTRSVKRDSKGNTTLREVPDTEAQHIRHQRKNTLDALDANADRRPSVVETIDTIVDDMDGARIQQKPSKPRVVALPFTIPTPGQGRDRDDANSVTTAAGGAGADDDDVPSVPRIPARMAHERANPRHSHGVSGSDHDLGSDVPHADEDRASSVDATLDDLTDDEELAAKTQEPSSAAAARTSTDGAVRRKSASSLDKPVARAGVAVPKDSAIEKRQSMPLLDHLEQAQAGNADDPLFAPATDLSDKLGLKTAPADRPGSAHSNADRPSRATSLSLKRENLPHSSYNNVTTIYRTNEWAKHITADQPDLEVPVTDHEEATGVEYGTEKAVPVDIEQLATTAISGAPLPRVPSQASVTNPYTRQKLLRSASRAEESPSGRERPASRGRSGNASAGAALRASSGSRPRMPTSANAGMSSPALNRSVPNVHQQIDESPIEDVGEPRLSNAGGTASAVPPPKLANTLLGKRAQRLQTRMSTTSFAAEGGDASPALQRAASSSALGHSSAASRSSANVYSNFDEPASTPPNLSARQSVELWKNSAASSAASSAFGTPKHSARTSMSDARGLLAVGSQRASVEGRRLPVIQDADEVSLASRRQTLMQQQAAPGAIVDDDDMPLSQRREMIRRASINSMSHVPSAGNFAAVSPVEAPGMVRQGSYSGTPYQLQNSSIIYDSHQPRRGSSVNAAARESRLAEWRADLARDASTERGHSFSATQAQEGSLARIMGERRSKAEDEQRRQAEKAQMEREMEERMRSGHMQQAHREMLRKMQRSASTNR